MGFSTRGLAGVLDLEGVASRLETVLPEDALLLLGAMTLPPSINSRDKLAVDEDIGIFDKFHELLTAVKGFEIDIDANFTNTSIDQCYWQLRVVGTANADDRSTQGGANATDSWGCNGTGELKDLDTRKGPLVFRVDTFGPSSWVLVVVMKLLEIVPRLVLDGYAL